MSARVKPWLLLAGIFVIGVITGAALVIGLAPRFERPRNGMGDMRADWITFMNDRLNLTADQKAKIKPIIIDAASRIRALHREEIARGSEIIKTAHEQIRTILTPEQKIQFQKMEDDREKLFTKRMRNWGPPPGPGGPGMFEPHPGMDQPGGGQHMQPPSGAQGPVHVPPPPEEQK